MSRFDIPPEEEKSEIKPIPVGKEPTKEEFEQAVENLFQEIYHGHWRPNL